jgi:hypothetical protein
MIRRPFRPSGLLGPALLIVAGVIALLCETGHLDAAHFLDWCQQWWPVLLIGIGLVALVESWLYRHESVPYRCFRGIRTALFLYFLAWLVFHHGSFGIYVSGHKLDANDLARFLSPQ